MVYSKLAGKQGKTVHLKMRNQLRDMVRQSGLTPSDLPEAVVEDSEYDKEPGGVRLDGAPYGTKSNINGDLDKVKAASSNLNPSSPPWIPTSTAIQQNVKKIDQPEIAELDGTPKWSGNITAHPVSDVTSQNVQAHQNGYQHQNDQHNQNQSVPAIKGAGETLDHVAFPNHSLSINVSSGITSYSSVPANNEHRVAHSAKSNSQFVSGSYEQSQSNPTMATYSQLSGSASMGNLGHRTPIRQSNDGLQYSQGGNEAFNQPDVVSTDSDTPKIFNASGLMTEPRNFAPRTTANLANLGAPPKFNLENGSNVNNTPVLNVQGPVVVSNSQGPIQQPIFGSQNDTTHLFATGEDLFPTSTAVALKINDLPRDDKAQTAQNGGQVGQIQQLYFDNEGQTMNTQGMATPGVTAQGMLAHHVGDGGILTNMQAGPYQSFAVNNAMLVTYQAGCPSQNAVAPYGASVPEHIRAQRSMELNRLTASSTGLPTVQFALHQANFPFAEPATHPAHFMVRGVVKIGNIPFITKRSEIIAVLGRNSRILNDTEEPVHIIMERITGKTTDAYVEFHTLEDASKAVEKYQQNIGRGRVTRIGQRPVDIELSSQASLMKDLFPSAKGVFWVGFNPQILPNNDQEPWGNFKGFVSNEEMTMLVKHVEVPHRSPFSRECPQRPFECLISTLTKFPWHMKANVTIQQRHAIHKATCDLIRILVGSIQERRDELNLTHRLLKRVVTSAMRCEGFSALQKDDIAYLVGMDEMEQRAFGQPRFAESWRHLYVLVPKTGVPLDVIEWYIALIREETNRFLEMQSFQEKAQTLAVGQETDGYFGHFWRELNHPVGTNFDRMTLSQLAMHEYQTMESIIRRALTPTNVQ